MKHLTSLAFSSVALLLFACSPSDEGTTSDTPIEPTFEQGKNDRLGGIREVATLGIGQEFAGEFTEDLQFFGHVFYAGKTGSKVDLEVTQKGSSRGLDTTLFLYGEKEPGDWQRLMTDDNDGWGDLSKLGGVEFLGNFSRYMAVVGTSDGLGRGSYNFAVSCVSGDCALDMPSMASCPDTAINWIQECIDDSVIHGDGEVHESTLYCTEPDIAADYYDWDCNVGAFATPEAYCSQGFTVFTEVFYPACAVELMGPLQGTLKLEAGSPISDELDEAIQLNACIECVDEGSVYLYGNGEATMQDIMFEVQGIEGFQTFLWNTFDDVKFEDTVNADVQAAVFKEFGVSASDEITLGSMYTEWEPAAGASEYIHADVIVHLPTQRVLVLRSIAGD